MKFIADLHIHSKYSRATSKRNNILELYKYSMIKGINLLGTSDFTHPGWIKELKEHLKEDGQGLLDLKTQYKKQINTEFPQFKDKLMKFIFSVEISSIYKKAGRVRKIHNIIFMPDLKSVEKFNAKLDEIGNIKSDGRPILGLDSKKLFEIALDTNPEAMLIPAHIWTPWFSLFGMMSGFDTIEECYDDLTKEIFAVETGLSSDPLMNWRLSALDKYNLVSNSDAHSPDNLAREANLFDTDLDYFKIRNALKDKKSNEFLGTIEFFPEEGKYHYDGHRNCNSRLKPEEAIANKLICPVCGKKITVGVCHRVVQLADRKKGFKPKSAKSYQSIIPLKEIIGNAFGIGKSTKKVQGVYDKLLNQLDNELFILNDVPIEEIKKYSTEIIAEGVRRVRKGEVEILPGYDGEYGKVIIFDEQDRIKNVSQAFFTTMKIEKPKKKAPPEKQSPPKPELTEEDMVLNDDAPVLSEIDKETNNEQLSAIQEMKGPVIVIAGPGTGKTYTLVEKIIYLIREKDFKPQNILAITFTNKAAREITDRLEDINIKKVNTSTFHSLALSILRENNFDREIFDDDDITSIINEVTNELNINLNIKKMQNKISRIKGNMDSIDNESEEFRRAYEIYQAKIDYYRGMDYNDIILFCYKLLIKYPDIIAKYKNKFQYILVDEFQDINFSEYMLIKTLANNGKNLFVIGDPDQSIYKFRGADPTLIFKLAEDYSLARKIMLLKNYRNPGKIMKAAIDVIKSESQSIKKYGDIEILINSETPIDIIATPSQLSAGIQIAKTISHYIGGSSMVDADLLGAGKNLTFRDFAILVRTSSQIASLEETLLYEGIPYKLIGEKSILEKKFIRLAINVLRLKADDFNNFRFFKVIESKEFGINDSGIREIKEKLLADPDTDLLKELDKKWAKSKNKNVTKLKTFLASSINGNSSPEEYFSNYSFSFFKEKQFAYLKHLAEKFKTIRFFLENILLGREQDIEIEKENLNKVKDIESISILTIHSAKGLEFPIVFIYEPVDGLMPFLEKEDSDIQEERRLFYVGITRAKMKLIFVIPEKRKKFGRIVMTEPSRFIDEINEEWIHYNEIKFNPKRDKDKDQLTLF